MSITSPKLQTCQKTLYPNGLYPYNNLILWNKQVVHRRWRSLCYYKTNVLRSSSFQQRSCLFASWNVFQFFQEEKTDEKTAQNIKSRPSPLINVIICTVWLQFWILSSWTGEILSIIRIIFSNGGMQGGGVERTESKIFLWVFYKL